MAQLSTGLSDFEKTPATSGGSKTIDEFCRDNRLSRSGYYQLKRRGEGPDETRYGGVVRISHEAESQWHRRGMRRDAASQESA
jgi:hypothetical protein